MSRETKRIAREFAKHARQRKKFIQVSKHDFVPTGATLLNLALSDRAFGGFSKGTMVNVVGDKSSGKTFLAFSLCAEVAHRKDFAEYRTIYDGSEGISRFNLRQIFGRATQERIEPPHYDENGNPESSHTVQDFLLNVLECVKSERPFIYILDSFDALTSNEEVSRVDKIAKARGTDKVVPGSYSMEKAKSSSQFFRVLVRKIEATKSLLIIISQTRDNINPMSFIKKSRNGGRALDFYATHILWLASAKKIKKDKKTIGNVVKAKVDKNKSTGKYRTIEFPLYSTYGIDDVASCIQWLLFNGTWKKRGGKIDPCGMLAIPPAKERTFIRMIEEKNLEKRLRKITSRAWRKSEEGLKLDRKPKYIDVE